MISDSTNKYEKRKEFIKTLVFDIGFVLVCAFVAFYKFPFVIYTTGGSINLNERIKAENTYPMDGSYSMNYVSVVRGNLPSLLIGLIRSDWDIVKEEKVTYDGTSYEETLAIEKMQLQNSLNIAKVVAFEKAGINYEITNKHSKVILVDENAKTDIKLLDEIKGIDDIEYDNIETFKEHINKFDEGHKFTIKVIDSDNHEKERYAYSYKFEDKLILGISIIDTFDYNSDDDIQIETKASEAGSSGGLMLTLAIYDTILEEDISKGRTIMGTGTMDADGNVGEIGGVKYKMLGAKKDGADIFFIPEGNYEEAKEVYDKYKLSYELVMVKNIDDAIEYLTR